MDTVADVDLDALVEELLRLDLEITIAPILDVAIVCGCNCNPNCCNCICCQETCMTGPPPTCIT